MRLEFVDSEVFRKVFKFKHVSGKCFTVYFTKMYTLEGWEI